jgi:hypothetical protein
LAFTTIQGSGANDATSFVGSSGVDTLVAQNVSNAFVGAQAANDVLSYNSFTNVTSNITVKGGQGIDSFNGAGVAATQSLVNSFINLNAGDDTLGTAVTPGVITSSTVFGGQGVDTLTFGAGLFDTRVNGNKNDDVLTSVGLSASSFFGGQGTDTINVSGANQSSVVQGDNDGDTINVQGSYNGTTINGNAGNDTIVDAAAVTGFASSTAFGGAGNDTINFSNTAANVGVTMSGDNGVDSLIGTSNADTMFGGNDNDTLSGALGADSLNGGNGVDTFRYSEAVFVFVDADNLIGGFSVGAGGDVFNVNGAVAGGIVANLTASVVNVLGSANNSYIVDAADTGYATFALAEAAVEAANATTVDYVLIFRNTTSGNIEAWADADSNVAGAGVQLVSNFGIAAAAQAGFLTNFVAANTSIA